jgi:CYTH domain-containing protein
MVLKYLGTAADVSDKVRKYAHVERERRLLLRSLPEGLEPKHYHTQIFDNYITNTRLRLRKVREPYKREWTFKLTQKFAPDAEDLSHTFITNIYLTQAEYEMFAVFEGNEIRKNRYPFEHEGRKYSVDVFLGALQGLILCETEFASDEEMADFRLPAFAVMDVTNDPMFAGGSLVELTADRIREELKGRSARAAAPSDEGGRKRASEGQL